MHPAFAVAVLKLALKLDVGPEYDTNANRAEVFANSLLPNPDKPTASALIRTTAKMQLAWRSGINLLTASGSLGGKIFFNPDVFDQDVLAGQLALDDRVRVGAFDLGLGGRQARGCRADGVGVEMRQGIVSSTIVGLDGTGHRVVIGSAAGFSIEGAGE